MRTYCTNLTWCLRLLSEQLVSEACGRVRGFSRIELVPNAAQGCSLVFQIRFVFLNKSLDNAEQHCVHINSYKQEGLLVVTGFAGALT